MTPTPTAFLLHGFLGAGKTTFAKRLEQEHRAVRFTHDEWMSTLYGNDPPAEHFQDYANRVYTIMEGAWTRCLELGANVVLDFGFWSRTEREYVRVLVSKHGGEAVLYRLDCPSDVAWTRISKRNKGLGENLYVAPETFQMLQSRFEPLSSDELFFEVAFHEE